MLILQIFIFHPRPLWINWLNELFKKLYKSPENCIFFLFTAKMPGFMLYLFGKGQKPDNFRIWKELLAGGVATNPREVSMPFATSQHDG